MTNKLKSLIGAIGLGAISLLVPRADAGSMGIWNDANSSSVAGSVLYANNSINGSVSGDSGDREYSDPLLGPGQTAWLKTTTQMIWEGNPYTLSTDNRPSTGPDASAPYNFNLAVGGHAVTSSGNQIRINPVDLTDAAEAYSYVLNLSGGALFSDGSSTKSGVWYTSQGETVLANYNLNNTFGDFGTGTFTPIPEPATGLEIIAMIPSTNQQTMQLSVDRGTNSSEFIYGRIQYCDNLATTNWMNIQDFLLTNQTAQISVPATNSVGFFRGLVNR